MAESQPHRTTPGLGRVELLLDVFVWAYERSCVSYAALRQSLGEPGIPFRLRHRESLARTVTQVLRAREEQEASGLPGQTTG